MLCSWLSGVFTKFFNCLISKPSFLLERSSFRIIFHLEIITIKQIVPETHFFFYQHAVILYCINVLIFFLSLQEHVLWKLIRSASARCFEWVPIRYVSIVKEEKHHVDIPSYLDVCLHSRFHSYFRIGGFSKVPDSVQKVKRTWALHTFRKSKIFWDNFTLLTYLQIWHLFHPKSTFLSCAQKNVVGTH